MVNLVFTPKWFYGKDIIIDIVSLLVLFLLGYFCIKYYKLDKNKKYSFLSASFFIIGFGFIAKILMNFSLYYQVHETKKIGFITFTYNAIKSTDTLFLYGFLAYRILTLIGLYMLYSVYAKQKKGNMFLVIYLILMLSYFSMNAYYLFHLTSFFILFLITMEIYANYKKNKNTNSMILALSFLIISISQIIFVYIKFNYTLYAVAEIIQLLGYSGLLITIIKVRNNGKKKK